MGRTKQETAPEAVETITGVDQFADLRDAVQAAEADLAELEQQEQDAVSLLPSATSSRRMELVARIKELRDQLIPIARAQMVFAEQELLTAQLRSTIGEKEAVFAAASAALAEIEKADQDNRRIQTTSLNPDELLRCRTREDELRVQLPAARLRAKQAERDLLEAKRPGVGMSVRARRAVMEAIDAEIAALKAKRLKLTNEGSHVLYAISDHSARIAKLNDEIAEQVGELRSAGRPRGLVARPTLAIHGNS